ncbi:type IV secretion system DNA-binding domain-containing protein [Malikia spinosa]|uniref:type IV secretion system DNA-binding domain-containing protein n=1 Tax=Malikia spinosa TaxID=86180 RepID=UPI001F23C85E|nr:type IV secretion system DNA-binding domain-containing protein [Malikia spinosa]
MAGASYVDPTTERTGMSLGVQDVSQLCEIYGHDLAKTIISGCQTKLLLRFTDGAAAKLLSDLMGQAVIL